jgi:hypothetical protein
MSRSEKNKEAGTKCEGPRRKNGHILLPLLFLREEAQLASPLGSLLDELPHNRCGFVGNQLTYT